MKEDTTFYRPKDIAKLMKCSESKAYQIIAKLNQELEANGFLTVKGRVSRDYLKKRFGAA